MVFESYYESSWFTQSNDCEKIGNNSCLQECVSGKAGVLDGERSYGTAFGGTTKEHMTESLIRHGFHHPSVKEYITSGVTEETLECYIFVGPIHYCQKLDHMVGSRSHLVVH